jgi:hypothetical protein
MTYGKGIARQSRGLSLFDYYKEKPRLARGQAGLLTILTCYAMPPFAAHHDAQTTAEADLSS